MKKLRIYVDTSVIGGCLDDEFSVESNKLIGEIKQEKFILLISEIIVNELMNAPQAVKDILLSIPQSVIEVVNITTEILQLRDAYINGGLLPQNLLMTPLMWRRLRLLEQMQLFHGILNTLFVWIK